ncbi:MAG: hypothetical protein IJX74_04435 [Clostridia bacterium]|nr:hypothetical protein [Clostridia bacterium]
MKKIISLLLIAVMCLSVLASCNVGDGGVTTDNGTGTSTESGTGTEGTGTSNGETTDGEETTGGEPTYNVEGAKAFLKNMYKDYLTANQTPTDFDLVAQVTSADVVYPVTWSVDKDAIKVVKTDDGVTIDVPTEPAEAIEYKLTATITAPDDTTATLTFKLVVPAFKVLSYANYIKAEANTAVVIQGVVVAVHSVEEGNKYNMLYVQDLKGEGGYYVYSMKHDPVKDTGIKMGMTVEVAGTKDIYQGTHEIKDATAKIVDDTVKTITPLDITEIYKNAETLKDAALTSKLGMLVTIKGVEITTQDLAEKSQYYKFTLDGKESYIRIYATDCPASVSDDDMKAIAAGHAAKKGWLANVTGVVVQYSGAIYLNPVSADAFEYLELIERTDAEKLEVEADNIKIDSAITYDKEITLPLKGSTYSDVAITWASNNECAVVDGGKLTVTLPKDAVDVTLTATLTLGKETKTVTYKISVAAAPTVVPQIVTTPETGKAYKYMAQQDNLGQLLFLNGVMNGYYFDSSSNYAEGIDLYLEEADGGYRVYFNQSADVKKYVSIVYAEGDDGKMHTNTVYVDSDACVFKWNEKYSTLTTTIEETEYYLGMYNTFATFSASKLSYADTSFVGHLVVMVDTSSVSDADKVAAELGNVKLPADSFAKDSEVTLPSAGVVYSDVKITWASDNAQAVVDGSKLTVTLGETATTAKLTATIKCGDATETKDFTISISAIPTSEPELVTSPQVGVAYKLQVEQGNTEKTLYLTGEVANKDYYFAATEDMTAGIDIYLEAATGGYKVYFTKDGTKTYINIKQNGTYYNAGFVATADEACVFVFNTEYNTLVATVEDGAECYLGMYNTYETFSASKLSYAATSFPSHLITLG